MLILLPDSFLKNEVLFDYDIGKFYCGRVKILHLSTLSRLALLAKMILFRETLIIRPVGRERHVVQMWPISRSAYPKASVTIQKAWL